MAEEVIGGRYRLESRLGHGAMSDVWLATDTELERSVAIKLLAPDADRERFEREARAAASLGHPNINQLYDFGESEGRPYMVLEYLPGGTLEDRLVRNRRLPDSQTGQIAHDLAAGLAHAHARGLVHRDLKPANVLFDAEGRAKIADFGIARMGDAGTLTAAGTVLGTAAFISPEQAAGDPATPASDVYSFGVILYRLLTGRLPFESEHPMELVTMHRDVPPPPIETLRSDAPALLESLATAALAKNPADRPPDGGALLAELLGEDELATATQVLPVAARPRPPAPSAPRRRLSLTAILAALIVLVLAGIAVAVLSNGSSNTSTPPTTTSRRHTTTAHSTTSTSTTSASAPTTARTTTSTSSTQTSRLAPTTTRPAPRPTTTVAPTPTTVITPTTVGTTTAAPPPTTAPLTTPTTP